MMTGPHLLTVLLLTISSAATAAQLSFDTNKDILVAQYDGRPDADDVHAQAAMGCMLLHEDLQDVTVYAVMNAYGKQKGAVIWDTTALLTIIFSDQYDGTNLATARWTNANREQGPERWNRSIEFIASKAATTLEAGGRVWIAEGGQSDFTRAWVEHLHDHNPVISADLTRQNVILVQHGLWNEKHTTPDDLAWVKANTHYINIDSGNYGDGNHQKDTIAKRTPDWKSNPQQLTGEWPPYHINHITLRSDTASETNANATTRELWRTAIAIIGDWGAGYSPIDEGGIDFSDTVAVWYILGLGQRNVDIMTLEQFWDRYVLTADQIIK